MAGTFMPGSHQKMVWEPNLGSLEDSVRGKTAWTCFRNPLLRRLWSSGFLGFLFGKLPKIPSLNALIVENKNCAFYFSSTNALSNGFWGFSQFFEDSQKLRIISQNFEKLSKFWGRYFRAFTAHFFKDKISKGGFWDFALKSEQF